MQKVILFDRVSNAASYMDKDVFQYISESRIESFESFDTFNLLAFDWYDIHSEMIEDLKSLFIWTKVIYSLFVKIPQPSSIFPKW